MNSGRSNEVGTNVGDQLRSASPRPAKTSPSGQKILLHVDPPKFTAIKVGATDGDEITDGTKVDELSPRGRKSFSFPSSSNVDPPFLPPR